MIPCVARIVAASCASTLTACVMWGGGNGVEISHAIDSVPVVGASIATTTTNANTATLGLVTDGGENPVGRLQPCPYESNCVSSNFLEPPNRYVSPLKTFRDRETAFARAIKDLRDAESSGKTKVVEILPRQYYLHVTVP
jgi:uncharacterized protein (DUF1499 family)